MSWFLHGGIERKKIKIFLFKCTVMKEQKKLLFAVIL